MSKRLPVLLLPALFCLAGGSRPAMAGYKADATVFISASTARGTASTARNSSDNNQAISCILEGDVFGSTVAWVSCSATNADGVWATCATQNQPAISQTISAINGDSYIYFSWDANGTCTQISVTNASYYGPKAP
jgi:hypothetical protein